MEASQGQLAHERMCRMTFPLCKLFKNDPKMDPESITGACGLHCTWTRIAFAFALVPLLRLSVRSDSTPASDGAWGVVNVCEGDEVPLLFVESLALLHRSTEVF